MAKPKRLEITDVIGGSPDRPEAPADSIEDVSVVSLGGGRYRVEVCLFGKLPDTAQVLEASVSLPVARSRAQSWRARNGGLTRGIP